MSSSSSSKAALEAIVIKPTMNDWAVKPGRILIDENGGLRLEDGDRHMDKEWLKKEVLGPWFELKEQGVGVMVGEWGAYNKTPHDVVLRWMQDCLELYEEAGFGWALWEFRGPFGIMDNERPGWEYVDFHGHKIDKKITELLQSH